MKSAAHILWRRLRAGRKAGGAAFVVSAGLAGTYATLATAPGETLEWPIVVGLASACPLIAVVTAFALGRMKLIDDSILDEMAADGDYFCQTCSIEGLKEACQLTKPYYGDAYVPFDEAEQWRLRNPEGFVEIRDSAGELWACFGVLGLEKTFFAQFIRGSTSEEHIEGDVVLTLEESKKQENLYISGVVVRNPQTWQGKKMVRVMLWAVLEYLRKVYGLRKRRTLYALAVTKETETLLSNLNFSLDRTGSVRVDGCNLYSQELTREYWDSVLHKTGDLSTMCHWR